MEVMLLYSPKLETPLNTYKVALFIQIANPYKTLFFTPYPPIWCIFLRKNIAIDIQRNITDCYLDKIEIE